MKKIIFAIAFLFASNSFASNFKSTYQANLDLDLEGLLCSASHAVMYRPLIQNLPGSDKLKHCTFSCMLAKSCDEESTLLLGILKELADAMGAGNPEWEDIQANMAGILKSRELDTALMCLPSCKKDF